MDSCLRRNDGSGKRAAPPRSSAALSFDGRFQTCPYGRGTGDGEGGWIPASAGMTGGGKEQRRRDHRRRCRLRAGFKPAPTTAREGERGFRRGRMDSCLRRNGGWGKRAAPPRSSAALSFEGRFQTCPYDSPRGPGSPALTVYSVSMNRRRFRRRSGPCQRCRRCPCPALPVRSP